MSKKQRANKIDNEPKHECSNCKCKRFNPCGCEKKVKTEETKEQ
jgi:hypothetical protein